MPGVKPITVWILCLAACIVTAAGQNQGYDACKNGAATCGPNSRCVVDGESHQCVCEPGYQYSPFRDSNSVRPLCIDIDECTTGQSRCHPQAGCTNLPGSYRCLCKEGYKGDGYRCYSAESMCGEMVCDPNAECLSGPGSSKTCICQAGYSGNGAVCRSILGSDQAPNLCPDNLRCDPNARCEIDPRTNQYQCVCNQGYTGNGLVCQISIQSCLRDSECGDNAVCKIGYSESGSGYCACKRGFYGDGYTCIAREGIVQENCHMSPICGSNAYCTDLPNGGTKCVCNEGFTGDGKTCTLISDCKIDSDCPEFGKCEPLPNQNGEGGKCACSEGYSMVSEQCVPNEKAPCNIFNNCHRDATCKFNLEERVFKCECNKGFKGNGKSCESIQIPCNVLNTCGRHAKCDYNPIELGFRCMCLSGYDGDGYNCKPIQSCRENPYQCHRDAECVFSPKTREYQCRCQPGYSGDGTECLPTNRYEGPYLIATQGMSFYRLPTSPGREGELLFVQSNNLPIGVAYDCLKGILLYSDIIEKSISRAGQNASEDEIIIHNLLSPEGLAIDSIGRNIYWTDSLQRSIQVARINGSFVKTLFADGLTNPRGIAVHPGLGKLYWTDWNRAGPKIEVSNMDGTQRHVMIGDGLGLPNMLAIDFLNHELCWTDAGLKRIECIDIYGTKRRLVHYTSGYPFGLAIIDDFIFWTDWETGKVHRVSRLGGLEETLQVPKGSNGKLHGLVAMVESCPPMGNPCRARNGGCKYLCLPNGQGGRTCACPDEIQDDEECPKPSNNIV